MTKEHVQTCFSALDLRERLIVKFAVLAGMRPGEILALKWACLDGCCADIRQRIYRGEVDSPKTKNSVRCVALPKGLAEEIETWRRLAADSGANAWVFPSENLKTPVARDNVWRRFIAPKLKNAGLGWVTFQVMRRTHSSLMKALDIDPKTVADQLGHTLDVNQNVYTQMPLELRKEAVDILESASRTFSGWRKLLI
jgi:integrase